MRFLRQLRWIPILAGTIGCVALLAAGTPARAQAAPVIYRWIDQQGIAHYTANLDRVPRAVRGKLEVVQPEATTPTPAAVTPAADTGWVTRDAAPSGSASATRQTTSTGRSGAPARDPGAASAASADAASLEARIASLAEAVERDEEAIKSMLSETPTEGSTALRERGEFRTIAQRLPRLQADLRSLRDQRDRLDGR